MRDVSKGVITASLACMTVLGHPSAQAMGVSIQSTRSYPTPPGCGYPTNSSYPARANISNVVRVFMPSAIIPGYYSRTVTYGPPANTSGVDQEHSETVNDNAGFGSADTYQNQQAEYKTNPFHVDLAPIPIPEGQAVMVRIVLDPSGPFHFYHDNDTQIDGIGIGDNANPLNSCGGHILSGNDRVAIIYLKKPSGSQESTFSFVIHAGAWTTTPIVIDPKVKEPG